MRASAIGFVIILTSLTFGQKARESNARDFKLSVDVDLVVFNVTVTDSKGHAVKGLSKENFRIVEDGQEQTVQFVHPEDIPATVGLVIDNSGSMRRKRSDVIDAAMAFAESSNPQDEIFIVNFNERVSMGLPAGVPFTSDLNQLRAALANTRAEGKTALYDAVTGALKHLEEGSLQRKALVLISDGGDNASGATESSALAMAGQSNATIYTIDIDDPDDACAVVAEKHRGQSPSWTIAQVQYRDAIQRACHSLFCSQRLFSLLIGTCPSPTTRVCVASLSCVGLWVSRLSSPQPLLHLSRDICFSILPSSNTFAKNGDAAGGLNKKQGG